MYRGYFQSDDVRLSFIDYGGSKDPKKVLLALHGHFGNARMFSKLASHLVGWRVFALDQRGHGWSEHPKAHNYSRNAYIKDIRSFIDIVLKNHSVVLLGHSLGGVNAYQFAHKYPELVNALIIEDVGAEVDVDATYAHDFPFRVPSLKELRDVVENKWSGSFRYFGESAFEDEDGWGFRFDSKGIVISHQLVNGSWWKEWTGTNCPALLIHGTRSDVVSTIQIEKMASSRLNTKVKVFENCGHTIHDDDPIGFNIVVEKFLQQL